MEARTVEIYLRHRLPGAGIEVEQAGDLLKIRYNKRRAKSATIEDKLDALKGIGEYMLCPYWQAVI